jgi:hypothetical protein
MRPVVMVLRLLLPLLVTLQLRVVQLPHDQN